MDHPNYMSISLRNNGQFHYSREGSFYSISQASIFKSVYPPKKKKKFSTKTYVVGTQKNRLNETVLLSAQHIC